MKLRQFSTTLEPDSAQLCNDKFNRNSGGFFGSEEDTLRRRTVPICNRNYSSQDTVSSTWELAHLDQLKYYGLFSENTFLI